MICESKYLLLCFLCVISFYPQCLYALVSIGINGNNVRPDQLRNTLKVIEFDTVNLECTSDAKQASFSWIIDNVTASYSSNLTYSSVTKQSKGLHECQVIETNTNGDEVVASAWFYLEVLYGPKRPDIQGSPSRLHGEKTKLTCHSDSNPPPEYFWFIRYRSTVLSRSNTLIISSYESFTCEVINTMIPSFGPSVSINSKIDFVQKAHKKAYIKCDAKELYIVNHQDVSIRCKGIGVPQPDIWWAKVEGDAERKVATGEILYLSSFSHENSGTYRFVARNTLIAANGSATTVQATKDFHIVKNISQDTLTCVAYGTQEVLHPLNSWSDIEPNNSDSCKCSNEGTEAAATSGHDGISNAELALSVVAAIGWMAFLCCLMILILRARASRQKEIPRDPTYTASGVNCSSGTSGVGYDSPSRVEHDRQYDVLGARVSAASYDNQATGQI